ncbi:hypothetical protein [Neisseria sicca]|nr:hypothetical protein [Neisseria sicca]
MPTTDRSVGFAHAVEWLVFESGDNHGIVFSWAKPMLRLGVKVV